MKAKKIALCAVFVALLVALQYVLGFVPGVELVTVFLLCFCCVFGAVAGMVTATCFSLIRCLFFGFYPNIIILYLIYYNLFALFFGALGKNFSAFSKREWAFLAAVTFFAVIFTALFTLLDDIISPLFYGYTAEAAYGYFMASLYTMLPQCLCTLISVGLLFIPLSRVFKSAAQKQLR